MLIVLTVFYVIHPIFMCQTVSSLRTKNVGIWGMDFYIQLSLSKPIPQIPKSTDAQVPYIKWHTYNLCTSSCILSLEYL